MSSDATTSPKNPSDAKTDAAGKTAPSVSGGDHLHGQYIEQTKPAPSPAASGERAVEPPHAGANGESAKGKSESAADSHHDAQSGMEHAAEEQHHLVSTAGLGSLTLHDLRKVGPSSSPEQSSAVLPVDYSIYGRDRGTSANRSNEWWSSLSDQERSQRKDELKKGFDWLDTVSAARDGDKVTVQGKTKHDQDVSVEHEGERTRIAVAGGPTVETNQKARVTDYHGNGIDGLIDGKTGTARITTDRGITFERDKDGYTMKDKEGHVLAHSDSRHGLFVQFRQMQYHGCEASPSSDAGVCSAPAVESRAQELQKQLQDSAAAGESPDVQVLGDAKGGNHVVHQDWSVSTHPGQGYSDLKLKGGQELRIRVENGEMKAYSLHDGKEGPVTLRDSKSLSDAGLDYNETTGKITYKGRELVDKDGTIRPTENSRIGADNKLVGKAQDGSDLTVAADPAKGTVSVQDTRTAIDSEGKPIVDAKGNPVQQQVFQIENQPIVPDLKQPQAGDVTLWGNDGSNVVSNPGGLTINQLQYDQYGNPIGWDTFHAGADKNGLLDGTWGLNDPWNDPLGSFDPEGDLSLWDGSEFDSDGAYNDRSGDPYDFDGDGDPDYGRGSAQYESAQSIAESACGQAQGAFDYACAADSKVVDAGALGSLDGACSVLTSAACEAIRAGNWDAYASIQAKLGQLYSKRKELEPQVAGASLLSSMGLSSEGYEAKYVQDLIASGSSVQTAVNREMKFLHQQEAA